MERELLERIAHNTEPKESFQIVVSVISKQPDANVYSRDDFENYAKVMVDTSALKQNNNPAEAVPKSSRGWKWKNLLRRKIRVSTKGKEWAQPS